MTTVDDWSTPRPLGARGPSVTGLGLGCAPLGDLYDLLDDEVALDTVATAVKAGVTLWPATEAVEPLVEDGFVRGAIVKRKDTANETGALESVRDTPPLDVIEAFVVGTSDPIDHAERPGLR